MVTWVFRISDMVKNPDGTVVKFGEVGGPNQPNPLSSHPRWCPWDFCRSFKVCSDAKERESEWGAESNGKLPHLFIPTKTAALVTEFAVENLPLGRTAAFVPECAVKDLPLQKTLMMMMMKQ